MGFLVKKVLICVINLFGMWKGGVGLGIVKFISFGYRFLGFFF